MGISNIGYRLYFLSTGNVGFEIFPGSRKLFKGGGSVIGNVLILFNYVHLLLILSVDFYLRHFSLENANKDTFFLVRVMRKWAFL